MLRDFINDPKLSTIIGSRWKFRMFKYRTFPKPWEYEHRGSHEGCFQSEYQHRRGMVKNICQNTIAIPEFTNLENRMRNEAFRFDDLWGTL
jgi:hypothetical protein